jgi:hypothetical protein
MKRSEVLCALVLLSAVPGAALAGLFPGALRGTDSGNDAAAAFTTVAAKSATPTPPVVTKPQAGSKLAAPVAPSGTQVAATGMMRHTSGPAGAVGGANHALPGQIGGASFTPKH